MKVLNVYLTKIYNYMDFKGYFRAENAQGDSFVSENKQSFMNFAQMLGYPEFGLAEGMIARDFSYLPDSDFINPSDLNANIFFQLPDDVLKFIERDIPEFYHQINISLAINEYGRDNVDVTVNRMTSYLKYLNGKNSKGLPKQADYAFLNFIVDYLSVPSRFNILVDFIKESSSKKSIQWQLLLLELLRFGGDSDRVKRFNTRMIVASTSYPWSDFLSNEIFNNSWDGFLSPKFLKNIGLKSGSFIEITSSGVYLSIQENDVHFVKALNLLRDNEYRLKVIFPEIDVILFDDDTFYNRSIYHICYSHMPDVKKKAMNTIFNAILNPDNEHLDVNAFNDKILTPIETVIILSAVFEKNQYLSNDGDEFGDLIPKL